MRIVIFVLSAAVIVSGCGPRAADVAGIWQGTWTGADGQSSGDFRVDVQQRGKTIGGEITLSLDWLAKARIAGVVEGQKVRWGVLRENLVVLTFEGQVDGDTARGTYTIGATAQGRWNARRAAR
jgi:hypothetical protein